ncbi:MAG: AAA family ATPase [Syntrophobacterales bacterium]|nr:AAA family ATPase [Syntrophobacterales bacterium]
MHIEAFHIDGFGIYQNAGLDGLPQGLVLLTGENESGKTTLLEFFRFMFFGPERRAPGRNDYQPLVGQSRAGRLVLINQDGRRLLVERRENKLTVRDDNGLLPPDALNARLGGVDRETFRAVFAVDLKDLQGLKVLDTQQVRSLIFAPGGGVGAAAMPRVLQRLEQELADLLKPKKGGRLNDLFSRLEEIGRELRELEAGAARFAELQAAREALEEGLWQRKGEACRLETRLARIRLLAQAREPWVTLGTARERLEELREVADFPPDGLMERQRLKQAAAELQEERERLKEEADRLARELEGLAPDALLLAEQREIEALLAEEKRFEEVQTREPEERHALEQAQAEVRRRLAELGPEWDESRLARTDTSLTLRQEVLEYGRRLAKAERRWEDLLSREGTLAENVTATQKEFEAAQARLEATPRPPEEQSVLQGRRTVLRRLLPLVGRRELLAVKLQERHRALAELRARLDSLQEPAEALGQAIPRWLVVLPALVAAGVAAGMALGWGFFRPQGEGWVWLPLMGLLLLGGLASAGLGAGRRHLSRREAWERQRREEERQGLARRLEGEAAEAARLEEEGARLEAEVAALTQEAERELPAASAEVEAALAEVDQALEDWRRWQAWEQECLTAAHYLEDSRRRWQQAREEREEAERELEGLRREWGAWVQERGFPAAMKPENLEVFLRLVEAARVAVSQRDQAREQHRRTWEALREIRTRLAQVLSRVGREPQEGEPGPADLRRVRRDLAEAEKQARRRQELLGRLAEVQSRIAHLEKKEAALKEELAQLRIKAGARDDADFERRAARHQEWREWRRQYDQSLLKLTTLAGSETLREELERELAAGDPVALSREEEELARRLAELTETISREEREVGRLTQELERLAAERRLGKLLQEQADLKEQAARLSRRYVTAALSRHLIEAARQVYEREHQPRVIAEADRFLRLMTQSRYRLFAPVGEGGVRLEDATHRHMEEVQWSAGLADQVYLAVRLGMAREFGRHCEPLPLILDDVLVKFDPRRRRGAARVILACARDQQVLFFSSHPEVEQIFRDVAREPDFQGIPLKYLHLEAGRMAWAS